MSSGPLHLPSTSPFFDRVDPTTALPARATGLEYQSQIRQETAAMHALAVKWAAEMAASAPSSETR